MTTEKRSIAKLDAICDIERQYQKNWQQSKLFEVDAPANSSDNYQLGERYIAHIRPTTITTMSVSYRTDTKYNYYDNVFLNEIDRSIKLTKDTRNKYRDLCSQTELMNINLIRYFIEVQLLLLAPICPHIYDYLWQLLYPNELTIMNAKWPVETLLKINVDDILPSKPLLQFRREPPFMHIINWYHFFYCKKMNSFEDAGPFISMCTSADPEYPASNILDGSDKTFWMTTGMFPQEFIISFQQPIEIRHIRFITTNVKSFAMFTTSNMEAKSFEALFEKTLPNNEYDLQMTDQQLQRVFETRHLKCVILSGYDHFTSVHTLKINSRGK
ncbi:unnamed protein product [Didymodactylos carnosus]|uniref:Methionyl/Valyl/Leucyl/Isoleucyl-tRNA synthetase anticodon-binding domain-containing protein n=1 Tax=Didymodactylos carnosus TaxID=1234261 RepID=A0A813PNY7_9BILA|nr:unnamed protein product [Didymodactylos carnosus]CAF0753928.1 unnamed protein product [Didymodactylos carnosus]CAF3527359.1 unnamed protein product [Didymodactylos carnosus]CAF3533990.1 unnamed protein product [Didymodactylos carnosus]